MCYLSFLVVVVGCFSVCVVRCLLFRVWCLLFVAGDDYCVLLSVVVCSVRCLFVC